VAYRAVFSLVWDTNTCIRINEWTLQWSSLGHYCILAGRVDYANNEQIGYIHTVIIGTVGQTSLNAGGLNDGARSKCIGLDADELLLGSLCT